MSSEPPLRVRVARLLCHCDPDAVVDIHVPDRLPERLLPPRTKVLPINRIEAYVMYLPKADAIIKMCKEDLV